MWPFALIAVLRWAIIKRIFTKRKSFLRIQNRRMKLLQTVCRKTRRIIITEIMMCIAIISAMAIVMIMVMTMLKIMTTVM